VPTIAVREGGPVYTEIEPEGQYGPALRSLSMATLHFNEQWLIEKLNELSLALRVLFAAIAAERLSPAYLNYSRLTGHGDPKALSAALERLWRDVGGERMDGEEVQENLEQVMKLLRREDDNSWIPEQARAEDAAAAVAYALRCRENGQSTDSAWAARRAYEAVDHFVIAKMGIDISTPGANEAVLSSPLVQAELARQQRDIDELQARYRDDVVSLAQRMRERALAESKIIFNGNT
jgi:uncharacterized protein YjaG (DUF416 family)